MAERKIPQAKEAEKAVLGAAFLSKTALQKACDELTSDAFYDEAKYFDMRLLSAMVLIYVLGECWEFCVSLFGIKRYKVSWFAVLMIGIGGFFGTLIGTGILPILGSFIGGLIGAFLAAFAYEYLRSGMREDAWRLAMETAKMRFLALIGKMCAGIALAVLLVKQIFV